MQIQEGYSYHLQDSFFSLINDKYLMSNKENGGYRPHFCAIKDVSNTGVYWMIPISSQYNKYKRIHDEKVNKLGKCDTIVLGRFGGNNTAFLIQNAFPILGRYVDHVHTINNQPISLHKKLNQELQSKLKTCLALHRKKVKVFFVDVDKVYAMLTTT